MSCNEACKCGVLAHIMVGLDKLHGNVS